MTSWAFDSYTDVGGGWLIFDLPEADMGVHPTDPSGKHGSPAGTHAISFYCDDIRATVEGLAHRGVEFDGDVTDQGFGHRDLFQNARRRAGTALPALLSKGRTLIHSHSSVPPAAFPTIRISGRPRHVVPNRAAGIMDGIDRLNPVRISEVLMIGTFASPPLKVRFVLFSLFLVLLPVQAKEKKRDNKAVLQEEQQDYYKKWLKEDVVYIITDEELDVFNGLGTMEEKEQFIEQFWRRRDPDLRTAINEYKEEHYRRIAYANERFPQWEAGLDDRSGPGLHHSWAAGPDHLPGPEAATTPDPCTKGAA